MNNNLVDFRTVKQAVPILAVLQRYQVKGLKKSGTEYRGPCPIHRGDGQDCFRANPQKQVFHCFSCSAKGNVLDFVVAMDGCSIRDAALKLQEWFGLAFGGLAPATGSKLAREGRGEEENHSGDEDKTDDEKVSNKPLGFALQGIDHGHSYLAGRGIGLELAREFGIGYFPGKGSMAGRVVIPIHNERGELLAYAGRAIDETKPRYQLPRDFHKRLELFNLHRAIGTGRRSVVVVEGFFDCMAVHQAGFPCVALMGCSLSRKQARLLVTFFGAALLLFDGDDAGRTGTTAALNLLSSFGCMWIKTVWLDAGRQPDQMRPEEIRELLEK